MAHVRWNACLLTVKELIYIGEQLEKRLVISAEKVAVLLRLYEELPYASMRAAEALRTDGIALRGDALQRCRDEEAAVADIIRRIGKFSATEVAAPWRRPMGADTLEYRMDRGGPATGAGGGPAPRGSKIKMP